MEKSTDDFYTYNDRAELSDEAYALLAERKRQMDEYLAQDKK